MGPGPPPGGSLGRLPGGPWGWVPAQTPRLRTWRALLVLASFFMTILTSIFDRLGVDLGSVLGIIFGRFGALIGQSWSQSRLRTVLTSKKRLSTKPYVLSWFGTFFGPRWRPRTAQDRPKTGPRSSWIGFFDS